MTDSLDVPLKRCFLTIRGIINLAGDKKSVDSQMLPPPLSDLPASE